MNKHLAVLNRKLHSARTRVRVGAVAITMFPMLAMASNTDTTFDPVYTQLVNWTQGSLGRLVTMAMIIVGLIGGIARQSLIAFAIGVGGGIGLYNSSTIVSTLFGANF